MHDWHWLQADNWKLISFSFKWAPQVYLTFQNKIFSAILLLSILMILDFALFLSSLRKLDQWIACIGLYGFWWSIILRKKSESIFWTHWCFCTSMFYSFMSPYSILRISRSHFKLKVRKKYETFCKTLEIWEKCHCSHKKLWKAPFADFEISLLFFWYHNEYTIWN